MTTITIQGFETKEAAAKTIRRIGRRAFKADTFVVVGVQGKKRSDVRDNSRWNPIIHINYPVGGRINADASMIELRSVKAVVAELARVTGCVVSATVRGGKNWVDARSDADGNTALAAPANRITVAIAASRLGVSRRRVQALIKSNRIAATKFGRDWEVDAESVFEYATAESRKHRPGGEC